ncbi:hypothetical protein [Defluviimonas salinarum]|uniref:Uncharacterized protein n=1 Tax=Defluviimonas salinarum TaxID=2992147 RepID=A0ABT3J9G0_9RHOB|nr:hypothetical protein [Defluviimonas salinarum]MCW3784321.1 hypothetical protein [Defluviimonas salinarum]
MHKFPARLAAALALSLLPVAAMAERDDAYRLPPLPKPTIENSGTMEKAFASVPSACRIQVQKVLTDYGLYAGPVDGTWSDDVALGVGKYAASAGHIAYGWANPKGAKGILWHIGFEEETCPMPPYDA